MRKFFAGLAFGVAGLLGFSEPAKAEVTIEEGYPGFLYVVSDEEDDYIEATLYEFGTLKYAVVNGDVYEHIEYLFIEGHGGNDYIDADVSGQQFAGVSIDAGDGEDNIYTVGDAIIDGGNGFDIIFAGGPSFRSEIYGGAATDLITVYGDNAEIYIDSGTNDDQVDCRYNNYGVRVVAGAGDDIVIGSPYNDEVSGDLSPKTPDDDDTFYRIGGTDTVSGFLHVQTPYE